MKSSDQLALKLDPEPRAPSRAIPGAFSVYVATPEGEPQVGPLPIIADGVRQAEAEAAALTEADPEKCLALPARTSDTWADKLMATMAASVKRADEDITMLRALHAEILGCSVEELDARIAADKAKQDAELAAARASRRAPRKDARKGEAPSSAGSSAGPATEVGQRPAHSSSPASGALPMRRLTDRQRELLRGFEVADNVARFTSAEHQPDWAEIKAVFVALGAKWRTGGKKGPGGFHFGDDADGIELVRLALETGEILDPKAAGFWPTPSALADRLVELAELRPGDAVLEPSAGDGAIARAVRRACPTARIACFELLPANREALARDGFTVVGNDFLAFDPKRDRYTHNDLRVTIGDFDFACIIANPPFNDRADVEHVKHMLKFLSPTGGLVSVMSAGVLYRQDKIATEFRSIIDGFEGRFEENPDGSFAESGTMVRTVTLVIPRRAA